MRNLKDERTKIFPSTTRGGKELPSSSALDSPFVISKLGTPKPATAMNSYMSHVIHDATSAMHDETTSVRDTTLPLGEFLDEQLSRVRGNGNIEEPIIDDSDDEGPPPMIMFYLLFLRVMLCMKQLLWKFLLAMIEMILRNY